MEKRGGRKRRGIKGDPRGQRTQGQLTLVKASIQADTLLSVSLLPTHEASQFCETLPSLELGRHQQ